MEGQRSDCTQGKGSFNFFLANGIGFTLDSKDTTPLIREYELEGDPPYVSRVVAVTSSIPGRSSRLEINGQVVERGKDISIGGNLGFAVLRCNN